MTHHSASCKVRVDFLNIVGVLDREPEAFERERVADFLVCEREDDPVFGLESAHGAGEREVADRFVPAADLARSDVGDEDDADAFSRPSEVDS